MRITKIQPTITNSTNSLRRQNNTTSPQVPVDKGSEVNFRGGGKGVLGGLGAGLSAGLLVVGGAAIAGIVVLPAIIGGAVVLGAGAAGAYAGDKIEDKINEMKKK